MKTKFIIQLDESIQKQIRNDLNLFFKEELELKDEEISKELELAMSGRLVDLENSIDINCYIN